MRSPRLSAEISYSGPNKHLEIKKLAVRRADPTPHQTADIEAYSELFSGWN